MLSLRTEKPAAFTIVELLVVIAIIGILTALLLPVIINAGASRKKAQAKKEVIEIVSAIQQYDSVYGRFPVSLAAQNQAVVNAQAGINPDFTYGGMFQTPTGTNVIGTPANGSILTNSEVMTILMNLTNYSNGSQTVNTNHQKNPQQTIFLNAKMSGWDSLQGNPPLSGVDNNLVYRDPWGNPYLISMDMNFDEQCDDVFYSLQTVSQNPPLPASYVQTGFHGLVNPNNNPGAQSQKDNYLFHGKVMVWSAGPDGRIDPASPANQGFNKDNILSWAQ